MGAAGRGQPPVLPAPAVPGPVRTGVAVAMRVRGVLGRSGRGRAQVPGRRRPGGSGRDPGAGVLDVDGGHRVRRTRELPSPAGVLGLASGRRQDPRALAGAAAVSGEMMLVVLLLALLVAVYLKGRRDGAESVRGSVRETLWGKEKKQ